MRMIHIIWTIFSILMKQYRKPTYHQNHTKTTTANDFDLVRNSCQLSGQRMTVSLNSFLRWWKKWCSNLAVNLTTSLKLLMVPFMRMIMLLYAKVIPWTLSMVLDNLMFLACPITSFDWKCLTRWVFSGVESLLSKKKLNASYANFKPQTKCAIFIPSI